MPKIDCGVCGAPTCLAFAEDVVMGDASLTDCVFDLPDIIEKISKALSGSHNELNTKNLNKLKINKSQKKKEL